LIWWAGHPCSEKQISADRMNTTALEARDVRLPSSRTSDLSIATYSTICRADVAGAGSLLLFAGRAADVSRIAAYTVCATTNYWIDAALSTRDTLAMARYHHNVYAKSTTPRYCVVFDLQWQIIECQRLEPSTDLRSTMTTTIDRLSSDGWMVEGTPKFGFVFLGRNGIRRLLILTERDPFDVTPQTFSPFKWVAVPLNITNELDHDADIATKKSWGTSEWHKENRCAKSRNSYRQRTVRSDLWFTANH
jgi:hypothetical protein